MKKLRKKNYFINNLDVNIITQVPKISKYKNKMIKIISDICKISTTRINIKGTTTEQLGFLGRKEGIACQVSVTISKNGKK